ncbi:IS66 family insertion sequence element accessory protein TnpB [Paraburkholderia sp. SIMBA_053]|uniref:IS66 family insertion sequence element accessory protein TnpB n=1 Tax=Paraburkholderia sp. SIMBA_053 TaxID=3085794 RepID=UPI00397928A7
MIDPLANTRIWVAAGFTDMRCGFDGLATKVQTVLAKDPFSGHIFVFRGKRGDLIKLPVLARRRPMPVRQTPGARALCVASC